MFPKQATSTLLIQFTMYSMCSKPNTSFIGHILHIFISSLQTCSKPEIMLTIQATSTPSSAHGVLNHTAFSLYKPLSIYCALVPTHTSPLQAISIPLSVHCYQFSGNVFYNTHNVHYCIQVRLTRHQLIVDLFQTTSSLYEPHQHHHIFTVNVLQPTYNASYKQQAASIQSYIDSGFVLNYTPCHYIQTLSPYHTILFQANCHVFYIRHINTFIRLV